MAEPAIEPNERISRFILDDDHFTASRVRWRAFVPPKAKVAVSTARTHGWDDAATWMWGDQWVRTLARPTVFARADLTPAQVAAVAVENHSLHVAPTEPDPPNHANILGWPDDASPERKTIRELLAKELAAVAGPPNVRDFGIFPPP